MPNNVQFWFVEHPISQYKEDVKAEARKNGLRILDAKFKGDIDDEFVAKDTPKLTLKKEAKEAK